MANGKALHLDTTRGGRVGIVKREHRQPKKADQANATPSKTVLKRFAPVGRGRV